MKKSELLSNTGLSAEAVNALESIGITTVEEICELSEEKLFSISNVGVKSLKDILSLIKNVISSLAQIFRNHKTSMSGRQKIPFKY